jgi:hypothetical protein
VPSSEAITPSNEEVHRFSDLLLGKDALSMDPFCRLQGTCQVVLTTTCSLFPVVTFLISCRTTDVKLVINAGACGRDKLLLARDHMYELLLPRVDFASEPRQQRVMLSKETPLDVIR